MWLGPGADVAPGQMRLGCGQMWLHPVRFRCGHVVGRMPPGRGQTWLLLTWLGRGRDAPQCLERHVEVRLRRGDRAHEVRLRVAAERRLQQPRELRVAERDVPAVPAARQSRCRRGEVPVQMWTVPVQMWTGPSADVARSRCRCGQVPVRTVIAPGAGVARSWGRHAHVVQTRRVLPAAGDAGFSGWRQTHCLSPRSWMTRPRIESDVLILQPS